MATSFWGGEMRRDLYTAGLYLAVFLPVAVLAIIVAYVSLGVAGAVLPRFSAAWLGLLLNILPAAATGALAYRALARWRTVGGGWHNHVVRASPLYLLTVALGALMVIGFRNPRSGFGLVAQLVVWPLAAAIGGVVSDAAVVTGRSESSVPEAAI
jgi:hypothetical protein